MRKHSSGKHGERSSALWGRGGRGFDVRANTRPGRGAIAVAAIFVVLAIPAAALATSAGGGNGGQTPVRGHGDDGNRPGAFGKNSAVVPASLLAAAQANPSQTFHVIVQGAAGQTTGDVTSQSNGEGGFTKHSFRSISGAAVDITGKRLLKLARHPHILSITPDAPVKSSGYVDSEMWRTSADIAPLWNTTDPLTGFVVGPAPQAPAVAIVDSGVDASKLADFGGRVVANVNFSSLSPGVTADLEGHGTMVAGVLAGASPSYPGVAQNAPIVALRTADANGQSMTSDVIAAADWILANKNTYNIRVANFSMAGATKTSFRFDPLDQAVERLWFAGITVVAAAGNFGTGTGPVDMSYAPGNDPFVITVGAVDPMATADPGDDTVPAWSAYGTTMDGFGKPDISAPGRYMIAPVPAASTLSATAPDRVVAPGYMWMSGTSFAAPVVAGAAAQLMARHPDWGPDQVKGALMLTANYLYLAGPTAAGVGEVDAAAAASLDFTPPNPNENMYPFVVTDPTTGAVSFDQASWSETVKSSASWSEASWASASWASASWSEASWAEASWSEASWSENVSSQMGSLASWSESTFAP